MANNKPEQRKAFNFLLSYYDVFKRLPDSDSKAKFITAICEKQFFGIEPDLTGIEEFAYASQKHAIDKSRTGWEDIQKREKIVVPSVGPSVGSSVGPSIQEKEQEKEQVKEKEQKLNINERKQIFYLSLSKYLNEYGEEMINDFFGYWSEHGENDKKMRFEKQTTFGISQRLKTWARNEKTNFNNPKKIKHEQQQQIIEAIRISGKRF